MRYLIAWSMLIFIGACLLNCAAPERGIRGDSPETAILAEAERHARAAISAYKGNDLTKSAKELAAAKQVLDQLNLKTDAEKIDFLDRHFSPSEAGLSFAILEEELRAGRSPQTASAEPVQIPDNAGNAGMAPQIGLPALPAAAEEAEEPAAEDSSAETTWTPDEPSNGAAANNPASQADIRFTLPGLNGKSYFDQNLHNFIQYEIREVAIHMGEREDFQLPSDFVKEIEYYIRRFQNEPHYREFFERTLRRSRKYIPALKEYFIAKGFPEEIIYLAFIESGFNPVAKSRSNAVGMFQFIKSTGLMYKLKINKWTDERYSPVKSAVAAREYLKDLLLELGSFTLALSSYNSGAGKTRQALRQLDDFKDRSFWALREKTTVLKHETREYVPQIFAAIVMAQPGHPPRFGFEDVPFPDESSYRTVLVPRQTSLSRIAEAAGISVESLIALNPDLEPGATATPARVLDYPLFVPRGTEKKITQYVKTPPPVATKNTSPPRQPAQSSSRGSQSVDANDRGMRGYSANSRDGRGYPANTRQEQETAASPSGNDIRYQVQSGNSLVQIANWFGTSIEQLEAWNPHLSSRDIQPGDVIAIKETDYYWSTASHKIRRGETLSGIARRYGVSADDLRDWNGVQGNRIIAGNTLTVYIRGNRGTASRVQERNAQSHTPPPASSTANDHGGSGVLVRQTIAEGETFAYQVASGNTLSDIANMFGVSVREIMYWNGLGSSQIKAGQRLKIVSGKNMKFHKYRVQGRETLSDIARQFDTSVRAIQIANGKRDSGVRVGEVLSIFSL
ncbi:MAG: LysM peptidoglycan-binding domain-containing protein [Calditrichaceae bacterium]|nr:LysM peptidoglycan-binding domain-containing protein [Calditrichia bacterium]NUQ42223.1 LysM peptidoglycan-binding domain-containing protein [Calditrichaceae bacterium]